MEWTGARYADTPTVEARIWIDAPITGFDTEEEGIAAANDTGSGVTPNAYNPSFTYNTPYPALPANQYGRVVFSDTLLELLEPDEVGAVFAHEVAHLEHFAARPALRARRSGTW